MKKKLLFAAIALTAMASCTEDSFVGEQSQQEANASEGAISFNLNTSAVTRGDKTGSDAAGDLSSQFIVYGEKNETSYTAPAAGNLVFQNYKVTYGANTAYTTTSNTKDWEYVGNQWTSAEQAKISTSTTDVQTIKYWDYGASSYTFTAVSALPADISSGNITITKTTESNASLGQYGKGYTVSVSNTTADLSKLYFSDRLNITKTTGADRTATNAYGGNVTLKFRNLLSHVRVGMYETVPGYGISAIKFYVFNPNDGLLTANALNSSSQACFGAKCPNISQATYTGTLTVIYGGAESDIKNQPIITVSGTPNQNLLLGTNINTISTSTMLKTVASDPTWDTSGGTYTAVMPQINNNVNLQLKCDYTLYNSITQETIEVKGATAEIPAQYLQWKPNYKYTYLFKISDNTNGSSGTPGTDPAGLYPITFDAVEVVAEDGKAEYITTVSEPSITTFGVVVNSSNEFQAYQTDKNEYQAPSGTDKLDIYATFVEGSTVKTPTVGTSGAQHVNVFKVTTVDATNYPITEASVAEAIAANKSNAMNVDVYTYDGSSTYTKVTDAATLNASTTYYKADSESRTPGEGSYVQTQAIADVDYVIVKIKATIINTDASENFSAVPAAVTTVPGEDGVNKTIDALKLTGVKAGTYAIEYEASAAWTGTYKKVYKVIVVQ